MEFTLGQYYYFKGMQDVIKQVCQSCPTCWTNKVCYKKYGKLPPKSPEIIPWHTLCINLIGLYKIGNNKEEIALHCLTMIDPAMGWFEIAEVPTKQADNVVNILEFNWLTRYPWPTKIIMDRGKEFAAEVQNTIHNKYGIKKS